MDPSGLTGCFDEAPLILVRHERRRQHPGDAERHTRQLRFVEHGTRARSFDIDKREQLRTTSFLFFFLLDITSICAA